MSNSQINQFNKNIPIYKSAYNNLRDISNQKYESDKKASSNMGSVSTSANVKSQNYSNNIFSNSNKIILNKNVLRQQNEGNNRIIKKQLFSNSTKGQLSPSNGHSSTIKMFISKESNENKESVVNSVINEILKLTPISEIKIKSTPLKQISQFKRIVEDALPLLPTETSYFSKSALPKKLTQKKIEEEKCYLKTFMKANVLSLDENTINQRLRLPMANKNLNLMHDFIRRRKTIIRNDFDYSNTSQENKSLIKQIQSAVKNPCLGSEYIKREYYGNECFKTGQLFYENRFSENYSTKSFGSVLFAKRVNKEDESQSTKYDNFKNNKITQVSKQKMKWKTIKWILENKKDVIDRLMNFHNNKLKNKNEDIDKGLNKQEFMRVMKSNGITNDTGLINKLFWIFDENGDGDLKYKEIAFGIEMFRESSFDQKLKAFFDCSDVDNSGAISKQEFLDLLKKNIIDGEEKIYMNKVVEKIFNSVQLNSNGEITFDKLKEDCEKNKELQDMINKNVNALSNIDYAIDKDLKKDIQKFNPELNDQLRMKLLSTTISFTPLREEKFVNLFNNFIGNREKVIEINKMREINEEDSYEAEDDYKYLFCQEKEIVKIMNERRSSMCCDKNDYNY